jgi:magnesium chelatase family protein
MTIARLEAAAVLGLDAFKVEVEIDLSLGVPRFTIVGLPDTAVQEARQRVRAAIANSEFEFPLRKITVNLAPADVKKEGPAYDLPIALGILIASKQIKVQTTKDFWLIGELSLSGLVRHINGILPIAAAARRFSKRGVIVPAKNASEAAVVKGIEIIPVNSLVEAANFLSKKASIEPVTINLEGIFSHNQKHQVDFADVKGQQGAKRALEIAAAGSHNLLMVGPPGSGKTMLARRLPTILPPLQIDEAVEVTKIYSVSGILKTGQALVKNRPFRAPHHTVSAAGLVGGGTYPRPGEVSLSHRGVLFLDEFPEFAKNVLQVLRQPLEDGCITISRASTSLTYPARFTLISAMNPCPCGFYGDRYKECLCSPSKIENYRSKISGPLLDRIDIQIEVPRLPRADLISQPIAESSEIIRERVVKARLLQQTRFKDSSISCNGEMDVKQIHKYCQLGKAESQFLENAIDKLHFSARAYDRILKLSRTIADLANREKIKVEDIAESIQYRLFDRRQLFHG